MKVLIFNCGSSTVKSQLYEMPEASVLSRALVDRIGSNTGTLRIEWDGTENAFPRSVSTHAEGVRLILNSMTEEHGVLANPAEIDAVGHRVVHGGEAFSESVRIEADVIRVIERYASLAPLHNPPNLAGIRAVSDVLPSVPQVACFDTAFHTTLPPKAYLYALPYELYARDGIRRYGFHGTSHRYVARRAAKMLGRPLDKLNAITCHLGNGCSLAAIRQGRSVDTSMGLTPLEGLVMGTRTGDVDPAVLLHLADHGYTPSMLNDLCNKQSGLLGISGVSNDMRTLERLAAEGHEHAGLAIDIFNYRLKKFIGAYLAVLGHVDALVFTGGIGEHSAQTRSGSCSGLESLGIRIDSTANEDVHGEGRISREDSPVSVLVIPTDEERVIAEETYELLSRQEIQHAPINGLPASESR
ncbi:MAG: acetate/propionate family kinase [Bacteroidota bacterium]